MSVATLNESLAVYDRMFDEQDRREYFVAIENLFLYTCLVTTIGCLYFYLNF